ncbi:MAG: hypothetical protein ACI9QQ_001944 [Myxococcota bacterium]|jgi:hypothetical protein
MIGERRIYPMAKTHQSKAEIGLEKMRKIIAAWPETNE